MRNSKNIVHERRDGTRITFQDVEDYARIITGRPRLKIGRIVGGPPGWHMNHLDKVRVVYGKKIGTTETSPNDSGPTASSTQRVRLPRRSAPRF